MTSDSKIKNVAFFNSTQFWGGGERFYYENALQFREEGINTFVICDQKSVIAKKMGADKRTFYLNNINTLSFLNPFKILKLKSFLRKNEIDTILFSTSQDVKIGAFAAKMAGVKKIVFRRGLAVPTKKRFLNKVIFKKYLSHIIANSEETKRNILINMKNYVQNINIEVIYNGLKISETLNKPLKNIDFIEKNKKGIVFGNAARLTEQKGQKDLIEVAKQLKSKNIEFSIFIAGEGELKDELQNLITQNDLQNEVFLMGFVEDIHNFMNSIDVLLFPSKWEGFGYSMSEAMIFSKPVIAYNITSNPEIITHAHNGFLVDFQDVDQFTEYTLNLCNDKNKLSEMGANAYHSVIERFEFKQQCRKYISFLNN